MIDRLYSHPALVALYDTFGAGRRDFGFYVPLVMLAQSVWMWVAGLARCCMLRARRGMLDGCVDSTRRRNAATRSEKAGCRLDSR
jgi:hypothetical protein